MTPPLSREAIIPRIDGIRKNLKKLDGLARLPFDKFSSGDPYDLAQHHLRLALEGIFHISSHILSRLPGGRADQYAEIARKMGELGIVPKNFATRALIPMAGLRNILVHAYSDIDAKKLHDTIRDHRQDIEVFLKHVREFLQNPKKFGVIVV